MGAREKADENTGRQLTIALLMYNKEVKNFFNYKGKSGLQIFAVTVIVLELY